jgi:hypothetical protein
VVIGNGPRGAIIGNGSTLIHEDCIDALKGYSRGWTYDSLRRGKIPEFMHVKKTRVGWSQSFGVCIDRLVCISILCASTWTAKCLFAFIYTCYLLLCYVWWPLQLFICGLIPPRCWARSWWRRWLLRAPVNSCWSYSLELDSAPVWLYIVLFWMTVFWIFTFVVVRPFVCRVVNIQVLHSASLKHLYVWIVLCRCLGCTNIYSVLLYG